MSTKSRAVQFSLSPSEFHCLECDARNEYRNLADQTHWIIRQYLIGKGYPIIRAEADGDKLMIDDEQEIK